MAYRTEITLRIQKTLVAPMIKQVEKCGSGREYIYAVADPDKLQRRDDWLPILNTHHNS